MVTPTLIRRLPVGCLLLATLFICGASRPQTAALVEVLRSDASLFEKARACQKLGEFGTREAVPTLASLLSHEKLGAYARTGLERIPGPEAAAALRAALRHTQGNYLVGVINSLAALRDEKAVGALTALTQDADHEVAKAALLALGRISHDEGVAVIRQALVTGPAALRQDAAAACLLAAGHQLAAGDVNVAQSLYDAVRQAEVPASYRLGAIRGAILARQSDRIAFLRRQLRSDEAAVRNVALLTIREIPSDALATALNSELAVAAPDLQIQLMVALKDCHNSQSLQILREKVQSDHSEIRLAALRVLSDIGGSASAPTFLEVLQDPRGEKELSIAASSLEQMEGAGLDEQIVAALSVASAPKTRVALIHVLGKRKAGSATRELLRQAAAADAEVSIAAFQALRPLVGLDEVPQLIILTGQCHDDAVRQAAASSVYSACKNSEHPDQAGALVLEALQRSTAVPETSAWVRVLALLGHRAALPTLAGTLSDEDSDLVRNTIAHLARWPDPRPIDLLFGVVEGDASASLRRRALMAVLQLATRAADRDLATAEELVGWFQRANKATQSVQEKRSLISGLGRVKHIDSVRLLASYLDDAEVKIEATHAILQAAGPLVKGPDYADLEPLLRQISGIKDEGLLERKRALQRDIRATAARLQ